MNKRDQTIYVKKINPINFCDIPIGWQFDLDGAYEIPFKTEPTKGNHNYTTCKGCQSSLKKLIIDFSERFNGTGGKQGFPFCCPYHSNLTKIKEFNRASFLAIPEMVADKIIYTHQHIVNTHQTKNYYKDITDYIDYTVDSFGQMPNDCGEPLYLNGYINSIVNSIKKSTEINKDRKRKLLEYLKTYQTPAKKKTTDFNILIKAYEKWFTIFPFEISFFAHLKPRFEKQLPILNGNPEINKYTGKTKIKMHTKSSLVVVLQNLTNNILTQINSHSLYKKGLMTEPQKIKLELVLNERKMKLKQGYVNNSRNEETRYRKIIKEWFADEKKFIDEVTPLLKDLPPQPIRTKADILIENLQKGGFYNLEKVQNLSDTGQNKLIKLLLSSMAYGIAMFDYLGFCDFLDNEKGTKYKANQYLSKLYKENAKDGTQAKHYRNSLVNNKPRYTSYLHKEKVIKDYEQLK